MAKDISLSDMPVFKKTVLGKNSNEDRNKEVQPVKEPNKPMPEQTKNEYYEMLDKMNSADDNMSDDNTREDNFENLAKILGGEKVEISPGNDMHVNVIDEHLSIEKFQRPSEQKQEDVIKFSDSDIEIVDEGYGKTHEPQPTSEVRYKSGFVADQLNISDQLLRNYCEYFSELVEIERTPSGQRQFSVENIEQLREIINYMKKNHYTPAQTVKAIKAEMFIQEDPVGAHELITARLEDLAELIVERMETKNSLLLEDKLREESTALSEKIDEMQRRQELILEGYQKIIEAKNTQIDELIRQNKESEETLHKLFEEKNENLISSMRDIMKENENQGKKKSWFPWNK